jgi:queuine tRNA-ribosyltransferase
MQKIIKTLHGDLKTPIFLPDATYGSIKSLSFEDVEATQTQAIVTTTLHLEQKVGSKYIQKYGGLHKFFNWDKPILTDSGGYQVFSLIYRFNNKDNKISDAGCTFVDYKTGKHFFLTPEISQIIQYNLGADIVTVLDVPLNNDASTNEAILAIKRNTDWARRSKTEFLKLHNLTESDFNNPEIKRPLIGAVIQGGHSKDLRKQSAEELMEIGFDIYNFGGAPIHKEKYWHNDAPQGFNREMLEYVSSLIPNEKLKYAMGVGSPDDILFSIEKGWDIFDTVLPTRNARHGLLYVPKGKGDNSFENYDVIHIKNKMYEFDEKGIDDTLNFPTIPKVSRAYLRYLLKIDEPAGFRIASMWNLSFYQHLISSLSA